MDDIVTIITQLVGSVGFPIAISFYLINFMQKEQEAMKEAITSLEKAITVLTERINHKE